jgi:hypothetical protein
MMQTAVTSLSDMFHILKETTWMQIFQNLLKQSAGACNVRYRLVHAFWLASTAAETWKSA